MIMKPQNIYLVLFVLGLIHGINPGTGWLLSSAVGYKEKNRRILGLSIISLAFGYLAALTFLVTTIGWFRIKIPVYWISWITFFLLVAFGIHHLWQQSQSRRIENRFAYLQIISWVFIITISYSASVLFIPLIMRSTSSLIKLFLFVTTQTAGYMVASAIASLILYETITFVAKKKAWFNFELFWALSLLLMGGILLFSMM
jgi:hypothetical protein